MTKEVHRFVKNVVKGRFITRVLDIGSYDVNGSVRDIFDKSGIPYTGLDARPGPNVDVVCTSQNIPEGLGLFNCVTCLEMLEHDPDPFGTIAAIHGSMSGGGILIITVPGIGFPKHEFPSDYWRFTAEGIKVLICRHFGKIFTSEDKDHVYAYGFRL